MADDTYIFQLVSITSQSVSKLVRKRMHLLRRGWLDVSKLKNKLILQGAIGILRTPACLSTRFGSEFTAPAIPACLFVLTYQFSFIMHLYFIIFGHRRRKCGRCPPNSLRPIFYFGSIWELYVLDLIQPKFFVGKRTSYIFP